VWQHSSGEVEISMTIHRICQGKISENRSTFEEAMTKNQVYHFFAEHGVVWW